MMYSKPNFTLISAMQSLLRKDVIGDVIRNGRKQARKSGENRYSFSILFLFALRHHFFVEKMKPYIM